MAKTTAPKTPTGAIARVLRALGLAQGRGGDFVVRGLSTKADGRIGTFVVPLSGKAEKTIRDNAVAIEQGAADLGFRFMVSVEGWIGDLPCTSIHNFGKRKWVERPARPAPAALPAVPVLDVTDPGEHHGMIDTCPEQSPRESREEWKTRTHGEHYGMGSARSFSGPESLGCDAKVTPDRSIVTVVEDLDPTARYALWACDTPAGSCMAGNCNGQHMVAIGTGGEISQVMDMWLHRYAERLDCDVTPDRLIVTVVGDLDPTARYALWVCDEDIRRPGVLHMACHGKSIHVAGTGAEIAGTMALYMHRYAERLDS